MALAIYELDYALTDDKPVAPTVPVLTDDLTAEQRAFREKEFEMKRSKYEIDRIRWERSNRKCLMIIRNSITEAIRGAVPECETAKAYLKKVESQFTGSTKAYASTLIKKLVNTKYTDGGVREHILRMSNMAAKLKPMKMGLEDEFIIHLISISLPKEFDPFVINYNSMTEKWTLEKFMAMCVQEEERNNNKKLEGGESVNFVKQKKRHYVSRPLHKKQDHAPKNTEVQDGRDKTPVDRNTCKWCKKEGHYQKNCIEFLKHLNRKGKDYITFVDESLFLNYEKSTWWIDSGATVHVANSLQGFRTSRIVPRGERSIRVANGVEAEVEAIGELPLELNKGFILHLNNVLYVPSLSRNLISVTCLDDEGFKCHFDDKQCLIIYDNKCVGLAFRQDKLYLLSLNEHVNVVCNEMNSSSTNASTKRKRCDNETSSKLWHCRLGHISRGRIERLIKEEILHPLDFSNSEHCIDCIKGKYVK